MKLYKTPSLVQKAVSGIVWKIPTQKSALYLTFDDGPIPHVTEWVLNTLAQYQAQATFFCIGANVDKHPAIFARLKAEGHSLGHHTQNHLNGWQTPTQKYLANVQEGAQKVGTTLFRPPYGKITSRQATAVLKQGHQVIMWNILSKDYQATLSPQACWQRVKGQAKNGSIIVFHDSLKVETNLRYALPKTLEYFSKKGFVFKGLS
jgi:peptidoglycan/xylan/chitin deacetylase (PgdA/CDA1 family)